MKASEDILEMVKSGKGKENYESSWTAGKKVGPEDFKSSTLARFEAFEKQKQQKITKMKTEITKKAYEEVTEKPKIIETKTKKLRVPLSERIGTIIEDKMSKSQVIKRKMEEEKLKREMDECTFKPVTYSKKKPETRLRGYSKENESNFQSVNDHELNPHHHESVNSTADQRIEGLLKWGEEKNKKLAQIQFDEEAARSGKKKRRPLTTKEIEKSADRLYARGTIRDKKREDLRFDNDLSFKPAINSNSSAILANKRRRLKELEAKAAQKEREEAEMALKIRSEKKRRGSKEVSPLPTSSNQGTMSCEKANSNLKIEVSSLPMKKSNIESQQPLSSRNHPKPRFATSKEVKKPISKPSRSTSRPTPQKTSQPPKKVSKNDFDSLSKNLFQDEISNEMNLEDTFALAEKDAQKSLKQMEVSGQTKIDKIGSVAAQEQCLKSQETLEGLECSDVPEGLEQTKSFVNLGLQSSKDFQDESQSHQVVICDETEVLISEIDCELDESNLGEDNPSNNNSSSQKKAKNQALLDKKVMEATKLFSTGMKRPSKSPIRKAPENIDLEESQDVKYVAVKPEPEYEVEVLEVKDQMTGGLFKDQGTTEASENSLVSQNSGAQDDQPTLNGRTNSDPISAKAHKPQTKESLLEMMKGLCQDMDSLIKQN